ncbi:winged helix-turn-helix domain-containing protein [Myceligenerans crystallogenes]|uniref:Winged helix-turn-helix domain-containing protein n=1 Tax=Myceligenerans crystallogenes TaxID=316335 RepID=A0ABN2N2W6_9MICO
MLRFIFTPEDLARVRLAPGPDPLWETRLAAHLVHRLDGAQFFARWRQKVRAGLPPEALAYLALVPPAGDPPDFLTPGPPGTDFAAGAEEVLHTPPGRVRAEVAAMTGGRRVPDRVLDLGNGSVPAMHGLWSSMRAFHEHAVLPVWPRVRRAVDADRSARTQVIAAAGVQAMLSSIHPSARWSDGILTVESRGVDRAVHLGGRGLTVVPSFFGCRRPVTRADPALDPVLVVPVARELLRLDPSPDQEGALVALLGRTRAGALRELARSRTTTALAQRMDISPASASEHASVLRKAGLVASQREGRHVVHVLTDLGRGLLERSMP